MGESLPPTGAVDLTASFARRRGSHVEIVLADPTVAVAAPTLVLTAPDLTHSAPAQLTDGPTGRRLVARIPRGSLTNGTWRLALRADNGDADADMEVDARLLVQDERPVVLLWGARPRDVRRVSRQERRPAAAVSTLMHVPDPSRRGDVGATLLPSGSSAAAIAEAALTAGLLVVDDVFGFPFEAVPDDVLDLPLLVRFPTAMTVDRARAVLGDSLLRHLTPLDALAGDRTRLTELLHAYRLPGSSWVGGGALRPRQLLNRGRQRLARAGDEWPSLPHGPRGMNGTTPAHDLHRLRSAKARLRVTRAVLREILTSLQERQPRTRGMQAVVLADRPTRWASAVPAGVRAWTGVELNPGTDDPTELPDDRSDLRPVSASLRVPLGSGSRDVAVLLADVVHHPRHAVRRLLAESVRTLRPGGWLVVLAEVVVDDTSDPATRPVPPSATELVEEASRASGRRLVLDDVRAVRMPGETHYRTGAFVLQNVGTRRGST